MNKTKTTRNKRSKKNPSLYRLYGRPAKPPKWWPREGRRFAYVGCLCEGGWNVGDGDVLTRDQLAVTQEILRWDWAKPVWRVERVPEVEGYEVTLTAGLDAEAVVLVLAATPKAAGEAALKLGRDEATKWTAKPDRRKLRVARVKRHTGAEF